MKRKITAVLLCVALLLTLSINVSANDAQTTPITEEVVINIDENGAEIIENENLGDSTAMPLSQNAGIISGGIYRIKNVASGKYMNVDYGIDADGTNIYQWTGDGSTEQKWKIVYSSSTDSYLLYSMCSSNGTNRVADIYDHGGNLVAGSNIKLNEPDEPPSQQVQIIQVSSGKYRIAMKQNNNFVYTAYGTSNGSASGTTSTSSGNIFISTYTGATNQQWQFELLQNPNTGATPIGHLDTVSTSVIGGWAYQSNIPNTALTVHIYITNNSTGEQKIIPVTANGYRADLAAAGYGNGYHAYQYSINWKTYKPGTYTVRAYAIGVNSSNPQLYSSPKTFTVRNPVGSVNVLRSRGVVGWAWKPDAPNSAIDVHIYIYNSANTQVAVYAVTANRYSSTLEEAGYGNGNHGFVKTIDWSTLPEDKLRVVVYAVDGSGYNTSIYSGYFNNLPIHLIGMIDKKGLDRSAWVTQEVINYAENIGTPRVVKHTGATQQNLIDYIHDSRFAVIYTHGTQYTLEWRANANTETEIEGSWDWMQVGKIDVDYFSNTDCLLLLACSTASEEDGFNNIAETIESKGIGAVVAFKNQIKSTYVNNKAQTTSHAGLWGKVFVRELGDGETVETARLTAFREMLAERCEHYETNTLELEILIENNPQLVQENYYCGLDSSVVLGDPNLVVKQ